MTDKHTPKWKWYGEKLFKDGTHIATCLSTDNNDNDPPSTACNIANTMNSHDGLVDALETVITAIYMTNIDKRYLHIWKAYEQAKQALVNAEEK